MCKAEWRTLAAVVDGLGGEGLVVAVHEVELAEDVRVVGLDAGYLDYNDAKLELRAELEMAQVVHLAFVYFAEASGDHLARQVARGRGRVEFAAAAAGEIGIAAVCLERIMRRGWQVLLLLSECCHE